MEKPTTSSKNNLPENITLFRHEYQEATQVTCNRKSQVNKIPKPALQHSEERFPRGENYYRPLHSQQVYQMPIFQNVDHEPNSTANSKTFLDSIPRFERRVLAHKYYSKEEAVPRIPLQRPTMAISLPSVRPEYRASFIHETNSSLSQGDGRKRHLVPPLLRRFTNHQLYKRRVLTSCKDSHSNLRKLRLDSKHKEVSVGTSSIVRLAGGSLQSNQPHSTSHRREDEITARTNNLNSKIKILLQKNNNATSRTSKLDRTIRSSDKGADVQNKDYFKILQEKTDRRKNQALFRTKTEHNQMDIFTSNFTTTRKSDSNAHCHSRCNTDGLGICDQPSKVQRRLRSHCKTSYQHPRITGSMVCTLENNRKECGHPHIERQFNSSGSDQTRHINGLPVTDDLRDNLETSDDFGMESINIAHSRKIQCNIRSTFQKYNTVHRMDISSQGFSEIDPQREQEIASRPIRNQFESQTQKVCLSVSRQEDKTSGCNENQLGEMETPLSVSPFEHDFEGFTEIITDEFRDSDTGNSRDSNATMVHGTATQEHTIEDDRGTASTNGGHHIGQSNQEYQTSRVEIIKAAYNRRFPNCGEAVNLMATPLRENSIRDYQHKWKIFLSFLKKCEIPFDKVTISSVLRFFTFLFYEKHLKPGTVAHYRSALRVPLKERFKIDLNVPAVADLLRAMWLQRPNIPNSAPAWSLNKVLKFLEELTEPLEETMLFRKTAFLLLLSTGWRVSELHACVRNIEFCRFSENSTLYIRPHPSFLAKNEDPKRRWVHKEIKVLKLQDGSISKLCPVTTLRDYLQYSSDKVSGSLLLTPNKHNKKLTIHQLSTQICQLIFQADNTTQANVHDIRKYATSCALAETMLVGDLVSAVNWSSPAVFYKFYLTQTEPLTRPVSLPVQKK